nr:reverse transcriptase domain-containing protein [Tanacetum cinerariifolium]
GSLQYALEKANRGNAKGWKTLAFDQRAKAKQRERSGKDNKKGGNLRKRQTAGNIDGATMAKNSEAKDHSDFLPGINNLFPNHRGRRRDGRGSSSEILYEHCFSKFRLEIKNQLIPANTPLVGFSGEIIWPLGQISLLDEEHSTFARMKFMVVRSPSPYNRIIGRPGLRKIRAIPSTAYGMIKFPVKEEKIHVAIHSEHPEQTVAIESTLTEEGRKELCGLLRRHLDVFAWKPADMTGVLRHIAEHRLNVREGCLPVR